MQHTRQYRTNLGCMVKQSLAWDDQLGRTVEKVELWTELSIDHDPGKEMVLTERAPCKTK